VRYTPELVGETVGNTLGETVGAGLAVAAEVGAVVPPDGCGVTGVTVGLSVSGRVTVGEGVELQPAATPQMDSASDSVTTVRFMRSSGFGPAPSVGTHSRSRCGEGIVGRKMGERPFRTWCDRATALQRKPDDLACRTAADVREVVSRWS
jgi:hypothetical protein